MELFDRNCHVEKYKLRLSSNRFRLFMNPQKVHPLIVFLRYWPIIGVFIGMYLMSSGWAAIFLYHSGIIAGLIATRTSWKKIYEGFRLVPALGLWIGGLFAAPAIVFLLPFFLGMSPEEVKTVLHSGLEKVGVSGFGFWVFVAYLCLPHPSIEELGWREMQFVEARGLHLRDFEFASYHLLVMHYFFPGKWLFLLVCLVSLAIMSWIWRHLKMRYNGLAVPTWFHAGGDLGAMLGVWWLMR